MRQPDAELTEETQHHGPSSHDTNSVMGPGTTSCSSTNGRAWWKGHATNTEATTKGTEQVHLRQWPHAPGARSHEALNRYPENRRAHPTRMRPSLPYVGRCSAQDHALRKAFVLFENARCTAFREAAPGRWWTCCSYGWCTTSPGVHHLRWLPFSGRSRSGCPLVGFG